MTESKKAWLEPELIVLVLSTPEEAVLDGCKTVSNLGPGGEAGGCTLSGSECSSMASS
jgi:hypothetical protein